MSSVNTPVNNLMPISKSAWAILAGVRFFLAFVVFASHFRLAKSGGWLEKPVCFGTIAAILGFLVISGFSIANSIANDEKSFYLRRIARIIPVHLVTLILYAIPLMYMGGITNSNGDGFGAPSVQKLLLNLALLNGTIVGPINGPCWSLVCEVFFYCAAPFLLFLLKQKKEAFIALVAASAFLYGFNSWLGIGVLPNTYHGLAMLSLFWAWGSGFYFYFNREKVFARAMLLLLGILMLLRFDPEGGKYALFTFCATAFVIMNVDKIKIANEKITKILNYLGDLSFPLFLSHFPLIVLLNGTCGVKSSSIMFVSAIGLSVATLHLVDRPCRKYISGLHSMDKMAKIVALLFMATYIVLSILPKIE